MYRVKPVLSLLRFHATSAGKPIFHLAGVRQVEMEKCGRVKRGAVSDDVNDASDLIPLTPAQRSVNSIDPNAVGVGGSQSYGSIIRASCSQIGMHWYLRLISKMRQLGIYGRRRCC